MYIVSTTIFISCLCLFPVLLSCGNGLPENLCKMKNKQNILKAFINAFNGMKYFFLHERNGQVQLVVAVIVTALSVVVHISTVEWIIVWICVAIVIGFEMLNTAIENLCNMVQEEYHPIIKIIKDVASAAVLWVSIISIIIGLIIFSPKLISLI